MPWFIDVRAPSRHLEPDFAGVAASYGLREQHSYIHGSTARAGTPMLQCSMARRVGIYTRRVDFDEDVPLQ